MANTLILVGVYFTILILCIIVSMIKGFYHLKYLKEVLPEEFGVYNSYLSVYTFENYNVRIQFLALPYFKRFLDKEKPQSIAIAKKVRSYQYLSLLLFMMLILPALIGFFASLVSTN